jgi:AraC family transcriptional regulator
MLQETSNNFGVVAAQLVEAACHARAGDSEAAKAHIARAMALLQGHPSSVSANVRTSPGETKQIVRGGLAAWQARRLTAHIDAKLAEKIRIEDLATLLGFSVGHFCRAFKSTFGVSAHDYLTRRRIEAAQALMLTTREPLGAIALSCGMGDQSHFTRWFRRIVGETPRHWRLTRCGALEDHVTEGAYAQTSQTVDHRLAPPSRAGSSIGARLGEPKAGHAEGVGGLRPALLLAAGRP